MTPVYEVIRSDRRTMSIEVTRDLRLLVRAPKRMPDSIIREFVDSHAQWTAQHLELQSRRAVSHPEPAPEQKAELISRAKAQLPPLVERYADLMGLYPAAVTITGAQKRWGSCSASNRLCFSWRLMQYPLPAIEYVVVHELAHIRHKNHGREFYALVASILPDYRQRRGLLRE